MISYAPSPSQSLIAYQVTKYNICLVRQALKAAQSVPAAMLRSDSGLQ